MQLKVRVAVWSIAVASALAFAPASPSVAEAARPVPSRPQGFNAAGVMRAADRWVALRVPYSQTSWFRGYRQDCSGFVSMAWNLKASYPTGMMPQIAKPIPKEALLPGDALLNDSNDYAHVVLFARWADRWKRSYVGYEQLSSTGRPVKRVIPYPYFRHPELFVPYRLVRVPKKPAPKVAASASVAVAPKRPVAPRPPAPVKASPARSKPPPARPRMTRTAFPTPPGAAHVLPSLLALGLCALYLSRLKP